MPDEAAPLVLVLEDNFLLARICGHHLEAQGFSVQGPFPSMAAARPEVAVRRPDAALLDVQLTDGAVFAFAAELRALGVPLAFVSGFNDQLRVPPELDEVVRLGKPLDEAVLSRAVRSLVAGDE